MLRSAGQQLLGGINALPLASAGLQSFASYGSKAIEATLFPGDGVGPEIANAAKSVISAAGVQINWDEQHIGKEVDTRTNSMVTRENLDSVLVSLCAIGRDLCIDLCYCWLWPLPRISGLHRCVIWATIVWETCQQLAP